MATTPVKKAKKYVLAIPIKRPLAQSGKTNEFTLKELTGEALMELLRHNDESLAGGLVIEATSIKRLQVQKSIGFAEEPKDNNPQTEETLP